MQLGQLQITMRLSGITGERFTEKTLMRATAEWNKLSKIAQKVSRLHKNTLLQRFPAISWESFFPRRGVDAYNSGFHT